ncbi:MAG: hypothetical protein M3443_17550, partial [Actinomycetota bacterium]|nr:hypothetical protein [Actinomycetota bacterium]
MRRALPVLAVSLLVLVLGALTAAALAHDPRPTTAAVAQPLPIPTVDPDPCAPGSLLPACGLPAPTTTPSPSGFPWPTDMPEPTAGPPCSGPGCIPQPAPTTTAPPVPGGGQPEPGEEPGDECGITDPGACVTEAIDGFFRGIVTEALNPLLDLLSKTLLTTPTPDSLPRVGELWDNSWQILLVSYGMLVLLAGVIAMGYQS